MVLAERLDRITAEIQGLEPMISSYQTVFGREGRLRHVDTTGKEKRVVSGSETEEGVGASPPEQQQLEQIFARYLDPVYRFLYSRVGNREDAEDLTSQVFLKASQHLDSGRTDASVASWLFTVARTTVTDHWRRYYRAPPPSELDDSVMAVALYDSSPGEPSEGSEQMVSEVLKALPPRYRQVLELRFLQGCSVDEAAREMGVTVGNLKVLQHRALARAAEIEFPSRESNEGWASSSPDAG